MTNKLTRFIAVLMVSLALLTAPVIGSNYDTPFAVTAEAAAKKKTPAISAKKKTVYYKSKVTLKINNYKGKVKWSTSNKKIAKVSSKGVVTGVALGKCTITAKAGKKTYKCTVTVKDRNVSSSVSIKVNGGGYFVKGESTAKVTIKPKKYNAAKATVVVKNSSGTTVYKKTLTKLTKNKSYTFNWNGKNTKGKYVSSGSYKVKVKIGEKVSSSSSIKFYAKNDFAGGNGAKKNPFVIASTTQLKKIAKYSKAYFKQTKDLDFNYTEVGGFFSEDLPFNGVYDGNGKTIKNISSNVALFTCVGEKGTIKNLNLKNCNVIANEEALLTKINYGNIKNCNINGIVTAAYEKFVAGGFMVYDNFGTITDCVTSGKISVQSTNWDSYGSLGWYIYGGGIVEYNSSTGKIVSCMSKVDVSVTSALGKNDNYAGGIASSNYGTIIGCEASGNVTSDDYAGGIAGKNKGQIMSSCYSGPSSVNIAGINNGTIA